jgi:hypothetical protein
MTSDNTAELPGAELGRITYEMHQKVSGTTGSGWDELVRNEPAKAADWCSTARAILDATISQSDRLTPIIDPGPLRPPSSLSRRTSSGRSGPTTTANAGL